MSFRLPTVRKVWNRFRNTSPTIHIRAIIAAVLFWVIIVLVLANETSYADTTVCGTISSNTTWNNAGSPYIMTCNTTVNSGATLTIDASAGPVEVRSNGNYTLTIDNGVLDVNGTATNSVTFRHHTLTVQNVWGGVLVNSGGSATFDYAVMNHAQYGIRADGGTVVINDSTVGTNYRGVRAASSGSLTINDSTFEVNNIAVLVNTQGGLTTARNTFNQNVRPMAVSPDSSVSFGSGADADILGSGGDINTYNGIALSNSSDCPSNTCTIDQKTFAGISNIPYVADVVTFNGSDDTVVVDAGVIIKMVAAGSAFNIESGAILDVNGSSGNEVYFTSVHDDSIGGDTNNNGPSSGWKASWDSLGLYSAQAHTLDYAVIRYSQWGIESNSTSGSITVRNSKITDNNNASLIYNGIDLILEDSVVEDNAPGILVYNTSSLTTARNTFNRNYYPIAITPDATHTFGSGADVDILGTGADVNGADAVGLYKTTVSNCPSNTCTLDQKTFAGISNIPYYLVGSITFSGSDDTVVVDPGVIIKVSSSAGTKFLVGNGAVLDVNGTSGNEVYFTSIYDDSIGGDTNNDGASSGWKGSWLRLEATGGQNHTLDYAVIRYTTDGLFADNASGSITVRNSAITDSTSASLLSGGVDLILEDSTVEDNTSGTIVYNTSSITTARNTFNRNTNYPVGAMPDAIHSFGTGADADILGTGADVNGLNAVGLYGTANNCPSDVCTLSQDTFAGISNIPYVMVNSVTFSGSNDTWAIDPGVVIKVKGGATELKVSNGAKIDSNGEAGNRVYFTSYRDDSVGGDTNNDGASSGAKGDWDVFRLESSVANTMDYTVVRYLQFGLYGYPTGGSLTARNCEFTNNYTGPLISNGMSLILEDSLLEDNTYGAIVNNTSSITTARNTFNRNAGFPVGTMPDATHTFGTGVDADILGTGADANEFNAIGFYGTVSNCPGDVCTLDQKTFAGISNIPYILDGTEITFSDSSGTLVVDPGVIIKVFGTNSEFKVQNGMTLDINGEWGNEVYFTSYRDDSVGGDTNNDGPSSGQIYDWDVFRIIGSAPHTIDFLKMRYGHFGLLIESGATVISNSDFEYNYTAINLNSPTSPTFDCVNFENNSTWAIFRNGANPNPHMAENIWWGDASGPLDSDAGGVYSNPGGLGDSVYDTATYPIDYYPWALTKCVANYVSSSLASDLSGHGDIYGGKTYNISAVYSDDDGAADIDEMYLQVENPGGTDIEYFADEGGDGSGLTPTNVSGSAYVIAITYDRDAQSPTANDITVTWHITYDWDWVEDTNVEYGVRAIDDLGGDSGWDYTDDDYLYENDLTFTGTLTATGAVNGSLTSGDWVQGGESITWGGLKAVYEGTVDVYPADSDFDVRLADDDDGTWDDMTSSGEQISIASTADSATDLEDIHTVSFINLPSGAGDASSEQFTIKVDGSIPDIVDITGDDEGVWQGTDSGPVIDWTDLLSPSGGAYYITIDGTDPTTSNFDYATSESTYDLPDLGEGETEVLVRAVNGAGTEGPIYSFIVRYDVNGPQIDSLTSSSHPLQETSYPDDTPELAWTTSDGGSGVEATWRLLDQTATHNASYTIANGTEDVEDGDWTSDAVADGVWYFHLAVRDNMGLTDYEVRQVSIEEPAQPPGGGDQDEDEDDQGEDEDSKGDDKGSGIIDVDEGDTFETDDETPTFEGTGNPGETIVIEIILDESGEKIVYKELVVDESGKWSWTIEEELEPGWYTVIITHEDSEGVVTETQTLKVEILGPLAALEEFLDDLLECRPQIPWVQFLSFFTVGVIAILNLIGFSFADLPYYYHRSRMGILQALGLRSKGLPWGVVYDSVSKRRLSRSVVRLFTMESELVGTAVTDINGVFSFEPRGGTYTMTVQQSGYEFPSTVITGSTDGSRRNIYLGGKYDVKGDREPVRVFIPIDRLEASGILRLVSRVWSRVIGILTVISPVLLLLGLFLSVYYYRRDGGGLHVVMFGIYLSLLVLQVVSWYRERGSWGMTVDSDGYSVGGVELGLYDDKYGELIDTRISDEKGRFRFVVVGGEYVIRPVGKGHVIDEGGYEGGYVVGRDGEGEQLITERIVVRKAGS